MPTLIKLCVGIAPPFPDIMLALALCWLAAQGQLKGSLKLYLMRTHLCLDIQLFGIFRHLSPIWKLCTHLGHYLCLIWV